MYIKVYYLIGLYLCNENGEAILMPISRGKDDEIGFHWRYLRGEY